jgi:hypothetical protein
MATYSLAAAAVPVPVVFSDLLVPGTDEPSIAQILTAGMQSGLRPDFNANALLLDLTGRYGGGCFGVATGLGISAGVGLTVNVAAGAAMIDGAVTNDDTATVAVAANKTRVYLYLMQNGQFQTVNESLTPPAGNCCFIGSVVTGASSVSSVDESGILYLRGPYSWRRTADTTTPADTPPAGLAFVNAGPSKCWFWDGERYWEISQGSAATPLSVALGGTGAATAAGARTNLSVPVFGLLTKALTTSATLSATETSDNSSIRFTNGGGLAANWLVTFPAATAVEGQIWTVYNNTGHAGRITLSGGSLDIHLNDGQRAVIQRINSELRLYGRNWPRYQSGSTYVISGTKSWTSFEDVSGDFISYSPSGGAAVSQYNTAGANMNRGHHHVVENDESSAGVLTVRTGATSTDPRYETHALRGEAIPLTINGAGSVIRMQTRPYSARAVKDLGSDANYTLVVAEYLAVVVEITDSGDLLTGVKDIVFPACDDKEWVFVNKTKRQLQCKVTGQTGVRVRAGKRARLYCDGTDIRFAEDKGNPYGSTDECLGAIHAGSSVTNTTTETDLTQSLTGANTLPANTLTVGRTLRVKARGRLTTDASPPALNLRFRLGGTSGTVVVATGAVTLDANLSARYWEVDLLLTCRSTGASGTVWASGLFKFTDAAQTQEMRVWEMLNAAAVTVDTTAALDLTLTAAFDVADAGSTLVCDVLIWEQLN